MITGIIYFQGALSSSTVGSVFGLQSEEISQIASEYAERVCMERGSRAFAVASPQLWNDLPEQIKNSDNLQTFKTRLKTYLFKEIFV